jgi:hypothetical protein
MPGQEADTQVRIRVARIAEGVVHFAKDLEKGEHAVPALPEQVRQAPLLEALAAFAEVLGHTVAEEPVRDASVEVCRVRVKWPDGTELTMHFTNAVPAYGLWKVERDGVAILEALEWGTQEAPPGAAGEAGAQAPASPMYDARVGEWLKFREIARDGREVEQLVKVSEVTDDEVVLSVTMTRDGEERTFPPLRRPRTRELRAPPGFETDGFGTDTITVAGKSLDCVTMTGKGPGGSAFKWWYCASVPATGLVRVERDGTLQLELLEFGDG